MPSNIKFETGARCSKQYPADPAGHYFGYIA